LIGLQQIFIGVDTHQPRVEGRQACQPQGCAANKPGQQQQQLILHTSAFACSRFSLAWTRIIPGGKAGSPINPRGVAFYNNLINEMLAAGIEPVATICE
jgi:hypothetical protein